MKTINRYRGIMIYGAKSIALGIHYALKELFPEKEMLGFLVSSRKDNPKVLDGLPVMEIGDFFKEYVETSVTGYKKDEIIVLIGTSEAAHGEIIQTLERYGISHYVCIDWRVEEAFMEQYFTKIKKFVSLHSLMCFEKKTDLAKYKDNLCVFRVRSHKDLELQNVYDAQKWVHTIQAGASRTELRIADYMDSVHENISDKNGNYCELTALYWIWKNILDINGMEKYYGMFQYRRLLNINDDDICRIFDNRVDVVLPFPTVHEPDIREHHSRYIAEDDWRAMLQALEELQPNYAEVFRKVQKQPYLYNYNIFLAKKKVLREYCAWLFPVLERTEELSQPKGWERNDRYIGYLGENLLTLYFMYHADNLKIVHTGRKMLV